MAIASAAPSVGSVPAHNSSNKTRECESTFLRNDTMFVIWEEKYSDSAQYSVRLRYPHRSDEKPASCERSPAGYMQPCLPHETEKSDCLQGNGLTTGIWTGHDQQIKLFSESDRDRNDRLRIQQRVTSLTDMDFIFFVEKPDGWLSWTEPMHLLQK